MQAFGIVGDGAFGACGSGSEQIHELAHDVGGTVGLGVGGVALSVCLEDVVHHGKAKASHEFAIEKEVVELEAVTQTVEVGEDMRGLLFGERDNGIAVEGDAAPDAVVVGRQKIEQEPVVGGEPFDAHIGMGSEVACPVG